MRLVHVHNQKPNRNNGRRRKVAAASFITGTLIVVALFINMMRPLPNAQLTLSLPDAPKAEPVSLQWPETGQAAIAAENYGLLSSHGSNTPLATASITKVITALCILEKHPIKPGEDGPNITMSKRDVAFYQEQLQQNGSNIPVYDGEILTLYEAIEALMIPSANNIADTLAIWGFGNLATYADYANAYVMRHGLVKTHIGEEDASGYDASTASTATDLAHLGLLAMKQPVLMEIAKKQSTILPYVGEVTNYNGALGLAGINGLKTGNNNENRGALLFTADLEIHGKTIRISGAVMGQDSLPQALRKSVALVASIGDNFQAVPYIKKGSVIGTAQTTWGARVPVITESDITIIRWKGSAVRVQTTTHNTTALHAGTIGAINISAGAAQAGATVKITTAATGPGYWWRVTRI